MKDDTGINREDNPTRRKEIRKINKWGIYLSIILILIGIIWYGVNIGVIPLTIIQEQAGPIILILLGLLILIKSF